MQSETFICGIEDTEDGDEVQVSANGGDPISIVCTKKLEEGEEGQIGDARKSEDVKGGKMKQNPQKVCAKSSREEV